MSVVTASIIVCTRNRSESLSKMLGALTKLDVPDSLSWEVIVIDNGSADATSQVIERFANCLPLRKLVALEPGVSRGRNFGIHAALGKYLLFTDDDCLVSPNWLTEACRLLSIEERQMIGGRVDLHSAEDLPLSVKNDPNREIFSKSTPIWGFLHGANLVTSRFVIQAIGDFDIRLGPGSVNMAAEDTDLAYRCFEAGFSLVYEPSLVVSHDHGRRGGMALIAIQRSYARGMGAFAMKHFIRGDKRPLKELYWDMRSAVYAWKRGRLDKRIVFSKLAALGGCVGYFLAHLRVEKFESSR